MANFYLSGEAELANPAAHGGEMIEFKKRLLVRAGIFVGDVKDIPANAEDESVWKLSWTLAEPIKVPLNISPVRRTSVQFRVGGSCPTSIEFDGRTSWCILIAATHPHTAHSIGTRMHTA